MGQVWIRAAWNQLIRDVNQILQNPPSGATAIAPIAEVAVGHRWSKADIQAVQNALKQTCSTITFDAIPASVETVDHRPDQHRQGQGMV